MSEQLIIKIQKVLTPDLLKKEYLARNKSNPLFGHCYVATEALYHLLKEFDKFKPCRAEKHWWLQDSQGNILDPTAEQYTRVGLKPPYEKGIRGGFLTKTPSKRASIVIKRVESGDN